MTRSPLANRIPVRLAVLVFVAAFTVVPCRAQIQDFEIMVNGPWQFVVSYDSTNHERLFVVAPYDVTHIANIWSGTNASMLYWMNRTGDPHGEFVLSPNGSDPNVYALDFPNSYTLQLPPDPHGQHTLAYQTAVGLSTIQNVLTPPAGIMRYAISLPKPHYVRTYSGKFGHGTAEAEIDGSSIVDGTTAQKRYSTWTVLHYGLTPATPLTSMNLSFGTTASSIMVGPPDDHKRYGISISLVEAPLCDDQTGGPNYYRGYGVTGSCDFPSMPVKWADDQECDTLSGLSFALSAQLWGLNEYILFPTEADAAGNQNPGSYDYDDCGPYHASNLEDVRKLQQNVARRNFAVLDLPAEITTLEGIPGFNAQPKSLRSTQESRKDQNSETIQKDFAAISSDLSLIYGDQVPVEPSDEFYCACTDESQSPSLCKLPGISPPSCDTGKGKAASYLQKLEGEVARYVAVATDKGSSDCHSPQISINGAIQPQP